MKKQGSTFREIAYTFDIFPERTRQIVNNIISKQIDPSTPPLKNMLPVRVQTVLINVFENDKIFEKLELIAAKGEDTFSTWKNLGKIGVKQMISALEYLGFQVARSYSSNFYISPFIKTGQNILYNYFNYFVKNSIGNTQYIATVRIIIESIVQSIGRGGITNKEIANIEEFFIDYNQNPFVNLCLKQVKENDNNDIDNQSVKKEAISTFNRLYATNIKVTEVYG